MGRKSKDALHCNLTLALLRQSKVKEEGEEEEGMREDEARDLEREESSRRDGTPRVLHKVRFAPTPLFPQGNVLHWGEDLLNARERDRRRRRRNLHWHGGVDEGTS